MANKIVKQKKALLGLGIVSLILFAASLAGATVLLIFCQERFKVGDTQNFVLQLVFGIILAIFCAIAFFWGIWAVWTSTAIKATEGSIADPAMFKGTVNGKKCPKCGCTNTPDATKCENCGADLE